MIEVRNLVKTYSVPVRDPGLRAAARSLFRRTTRTISAVDDVSLRIRPGEVVGFLGPNGAGKTTTLKVLSGLLHPTAGHVRVLGHEPARRDHDYLRRIALVMGNRNQLQWDIPASDSFELNRTIYRIAPDAFRLMRDELVDMLEAGDLISKPVRQLSLGERMKVEVVGSLLHRPDVLFLDEPTIGLDVTMQRRLRNFVGEYNRQYGATVMLTSHYMADVEALASRVVVMHHGRVVFDGKLRELTQRFAAGRIIELRLSTSADQTALQSYGEVLSSDGFTVRLRVALAQTARQTAAILANLDVLDLTVENPPIEDVIEALFDATRTVSR
jgi:ABC-2 type transport system ATP-binding protein